MVIDKTKAKKIPIPANITKLLIRAVILFSAWGILYYLFLEPIGIPDNQLTAFVVWGTVKTLALFFNEVVAHGSSIFIHGIQSVNIANSCNGLELIALYIGFILIVPSTFKRMLSFILVGSITITFLNIVRCALLAWMYLHDMNLADIAHHYIFKLTIYAVVFYGWMLYSKSIKNA